MGSKEQPFLAEDTSWLELLETEPFIPKGDPILDGMNSDGVWTYKEKLPIEIERELKAKYKDQEIPVVESIDYDHFVFEFLWENKPVLIKNCTRDWRAMKDWVKRDGSIDINSIKNECPNSDVCVTIFSNDHKTESKVEKMKLYDYLDWWESKTDSSELKYLKDWHCRHHLKDNPFYMTPLYFQDDWLSPFYEVYGESEDTQDYYFVYLGPCGSWTSLHSDVLRSYSWSANISGYKQWKILPAELTYLLYDKTGHQLASDFGVHDPLEYCNLELASELAMTVHQVAPGDCLFVPSGWHHVVYNLTDVLSVNHNWINAFNVHWSWQLLKKTYLRAKLLIEDCKELCSSEEFEELVQNMVRADCGMGFLDYIQFLQFALTKQQDSQKLKRTGLMAEFRHRRLEYVIREISKFKDSLDLTETEEFTWPWVIELEKVKNRFFS